MIKNPKIKFITLGCKVNQYETQGMREAFELAGGETFSSSAEVDFVVINTCTVTGEADKEGRYWIRRSRRDYPKASIVVTGCGVTRDRKGFEAMPEVDVVLANHEKAAIAERLLGGCATPEVQTGRQDYTPLKISKSDGKVRAFVKIQDGCNHACSFCKVVLARGRSRSRNLSDIVDEVTRLRDSGYREIVFAGIQLGAYGLDLDPRPSLVDVLEASSKVDGIEHLRLSSIEPTDIKPELIEALRDIPQCAPHLHIPLQSGDDEILKAMNRRYTRSFYRDLVAKLRAELKDFSLTLDVMAGFPGEGEQHFQNTIKLLEETRPLKCHIFSYSQREGTRASRFENKVPEKVVEDRIARLRVLNQRLAAEAASPYIGRKIRVLVEHQKKKGSPLLSGISANYLKVYFQGEPAWTGRSIEVELSGLQGDVFLGRAV